MITREDMKLVVELAANKALPKNEPIHARETEVFLDAIVTSVALAATNKRPCRQFLGKGKLDFQEMSRGTLLDNLWSSSGLPFDVCDQILVALDLMIDRKFKKRQEVVIENLGTYKNTPDGHILILEDRLQSG